VLRVENNGEPSDEHYDCNDPVGRHGEVETDQKGPYNRLPGGGVHRDGRGDARLYQPRAAAEGRLLRMVIDPGLGIGILVEEVDRRVGYDHPDHYENSVHDAEAALARPFDMDRRQGKANRDQHHGQHEEIAPDLAEPCLYYITLFHTAHPMI